MWCIGDANGKMMLAHAASAQGIAAIECMQGREQVLNHNSVPAACFTHPEVSQRYTPVVPHPSFPVPGPTLFYVVRQCIHEATQETEKEKRERHDKHTHIHTHHTTPRCLLPALLASY
jgi:hypothetical protein